MENDTVQVSGRWTMTDICLHCGNGTGTYDHLCEHCFRAQAAPSILPGILKMKICSKCSCTVHPATNRRTVDWKEGINHLVEEHLRLVEGAVLTEKDIERNERDDYIMHLAVTARIILRGLAFVDRHTTELRISYGVCNRCSRQSGNYYEAVLQFRGGRRPPSEADLVFVMDLVERRVENSTAENAFITSVGRIHGGLDLSLGDKTLCRDIAREIREHFGGRFTESHTLAGRKDGRDVYRATYLVRLPDLRAGDVVRWKGEIWMILRMRERSGTVMDMVTGAERNIGGSDLEGLMPVHGEMVQAVVVSTSGNEAQVLDPVNLYTVTVRVPRVPEPGGTATFFRCEEGLFLVPAPPEANRTRVGDGKNGMDEEGMAVKETVERSQVMVEETGR